MSGATLHGLGDHTPALHCPCPDPRPVTGPTPAVVAAIRKIGREHRPVRIEDHRLLVCACGVKSDEPDGLELHRAQLSVAAAQSAALRADPPSARHTTIRDSNGGTQTMTYPDSHPVLAGRITITTPEGETQYVPREDFEQILAERDDLRRALTITAAAVYFPERTTGIDLKRVIERTGTTKGVVEATLGIIDSARKGTL